MVIHVNLKSMPERIRIAAEHTQLGSLRLLRPQAATKKSHLHSCSQISGIMRASACVGNRAQHQGGVQLSAEVKLKALDHDFGPSEMIAIVWPVP